MQKTPVLFVFGDHGGSCGGKKIPPDRKFFRKAASPFLRKHALEENRPVLLIREGITPVIIRGCPKKMLLEQQGEMRRKNMKEVDIALARDDAAFIAKINGPLSEGRMPDIPDFTLFGLEEKVLKINKRKRGQITVVFEPLNAEVVYANWQFEFASDEHFKNPRDVNALVAYLRALAELTVLRDSLLAEMISTFSRRVPNCAILVLRGRAHEKMVKFLDQEAGLDIAICIKRSARGFMEDVIAERYEGVLTEERLKLYATLEVELLEIIDAICLLPQFIINNRCIYNSIENILMAAARKYVIEKNPEIARQLGIEMV